MDGLGGKLERFKMNITGISETKWFGKAVYKVEGYTIFCTLDIQSWEKENQLIGTKEKGSTDD